MISNDLVITQLISLHVGLAIGKKRDYRQEKKDEFCKLSRWVVQENSFLCETLQIRRK